MSHPPNDFQTSFKDEIHKRFKFEADWTPPKAQFKQTYRNPSVRRGPMQNNECFPVGDLYGRSNNFSVIVEYDTEQVSVHNLLKYLPLLRGDLEPSLSNQLIFLCHFSDWKSYGSHRDLWEYLYLHVLQPQLKSLGITIRFHAKQFDHREGNSVVQAVEWIDSIVAHENWQLPLACGSF